MYYKNFKDLQLSALGMGNMRLPTLGNNGEIDREKSREIIEYAYQNGINYFDTAFRYHEGEGEKFVGEVLEQYPRESFYLATKMPGHMMNYKNGKLGFQGYLSNFHVDSIEEIFEMQLEKCRTDYFDFYLLHNVSESSFDFYTNKELGLIDYLLEQKAKGRIKHLGFSSHGRADTIGKFLDNYDCFEFVQIQLNYLDWTLQDAKAKYDLLTDRNIPIIVMEPCRGGALARLNDNADAILKKENPDTSLASWAFRYLQSLTNVLVTLSGMTTLEQLKDNLSTYSKPNPTNEQEKALLLREVVAAISDVIPCTACRYCCDVCPQNLDIPKLISLYNEGKYCGLNGTIRFSLNAMKQEELPSACIACESCKKVCPQGIDISGVMGKFTEMLNQ